MSNDMLNIEHYRRIYENFKLDRPDVFKHSIGYTPRGDHKIRVHLDNDEYFDYTFIDGYGKYKRERPKKRDDITREYVHNDFADNLKNMMDRRGFSQLTLSRATGISQSVLSSYLRRNNAYDEYNQKQPVNPTIDKVYLIAWALDCDPYELM